MPSNGDWPPLLFNSMSGNPRPHRWLLNTSAYGSSPGWDAGLFHYRFRHGYTQMYARDVNDLPYQFRLYAGADFACGRSLIIKHVGAELAKLPSIPSTVAASRITISAYSAVPAIRFWPVEKGYYAFRAQAEECTSCRNALRVTRIAIGRDSDKPLSVPQTA